MTYPNTSLFIDDDWVDAADERTIPVHNPATGQVIGSVAHASVSDLDRALAAAQRGFEVWRDYPPAKRGKIMRKAADLIRERLDARRFAYTSEPDFEAVLEYDAAGLIVDYPGVARRFA